jgi:hypothetical protein
MDAESVVPETPVKAFRDIGPVEDWYCGCRWDWGGKRLHYAGVRHCPDCGTTAPWTEEVKTKAPDPLGDANDLIVSLQHARRNGMHTLREVKLDLNITARRIEEGDRTLIEDPARLARFLRRMAKGLDTAEERLHDV